MCLIISEGLFYNRNGNGFLPWNFLQTLPKVWKVKVGLFRWRKKKIITSWELKRQLWSTSIHTMLSPSCRWKWMFGVGSVLEKDPLSLDAVNKHHNSSPFWTETVENILWDLRRENWRFFIETMTAKWVRSVYLSVMSGCIASERWQMEGIWRLKARW